MDLLAKYDFSHSDFQKIGLVFLAAFTFYCLCYLTVSKSNAKLSKQYLQLTPEKQADLVSRYVANINAVVCCILAVISFFGTWYCLFL